MVELPTQRPALQLAEQSQHCWVRRVFEKTGNGFEGLLAVRGSMNQTDQSVALLEKQHNTQKYAAGPLKCMHCVRMPVDPRSHARREQRPAAPKELG